MSSYSLRSGEPIPDNNHVVRYCQEGNWKQRQGDGVVIYQDAFESERYPDLGVSVNWLEYWKCIEQAALHQIVNTSGHQGMRPEGRFLKLKTQDIRELRLKATPNHIEVCYKPHGKNKSHAVILPPGEETITALRALAEYNPCVLKCPPRS